MSRPFIKSDDIDVDTILGITGANGWHAEFSGDPSKPLLFWVLLKDGALVGIVSQTGNSVDLEVRAADKLLNFRGYRLAG